MDAADVQQATFRKKDTNRTKRRSSLRNFFSRQKQTLSPIFPVQNQLLPQNLDEFLSLLSHTLKTRLIAAESFSSLLHDDLAATASPEHLHYLERICGNIHTMHQIIDDLLKFARFGKFEMVAEQVDLDELVRTLVHDSFPDRAARSLVIEIPRPLPVVSGNREGLRVIFDNLLNNAAKYRHPEKPAYIEIASEGLPRFVAIHVRDNGIGIAPNEQHGVFQPFQRGSNVGDIEGSGLGLSICQKIVQQHRGQLAMTSTPGKGTTISFTLPK